MKKVLVTGAWKCTESDLAKLEDLGYQVVYHKNEADLLPVACEEIHGAVCNGLFLHHPVEKFTSLEFVQLTSAGLDRVPMSYMTSHNVKVFNAAGVYSVPMAEYAVAGVLYLYKQAAFFHGMQKLLRWEKHRGLLELFGKTVCILGCGNVGGECAARFAAFGCRVIGVDAYSKEDPRFAEVYGIDKLHDALAQSDILVLSLPLTDETYHIINESAFSVMKQGSVLVNISRGAVVDETALCKALKDKLFGAVLDVFEQEPLAVDSPLWTLENAFITPHNSFVGDGNAERLSKRIIENLRSL